MHISHMKYIRIFARIAPFSGNRRHLFKQKQSQFANKHIHSYVIEFKLQCAIDDEDNQRISDNNI